MIDSKVPIIKELKVTVSELLKMISETGDHIFNLKPSAKSWSVAEIADHTNKTLSGVVKTLRSDGNIAERDPRALVPLLKSVFLNFETKYERPEFLKPDDDIDRLNLTDHVKANIEKICNLAEEKDLNVIPKGFELPQIGEITKMEWLYFANYHTQRHIHQLEKTLNQLR